MDALTFLKGHVPLFEGISDELLTPLVAEADLKTFSAGQAVVRAGMTVDGLHVVATGKVEVHAKVAGKGPARVAELGLGEVFGEGSILDQGVAGATVKAGEAGALVLLIPETHFRRLVDSDAEFAARVSALSRARRAANASPSAS